MVAKQKMGDTRMTGRVAGKVALVTGGASGLGAESGRRLAREGASVVLTDLAVEAGQAVADEILAAGGTAKRKPVDRLSRTTTRSPRATARPSI